MSPADMDDVSVQERLRDGTTLSRLAPEHNQPSLLVVDDLIAIPVFQVNKFLAEDGVCEIQIRYDSRDIGALCLMSRLDPTTNTITSLTDYQYAAYLTLVSPAGLMNGGWTAFAVDCVVVKREEFWVYWRNRSSSALWGGFFQIDGAQQIVDGKNSSKTSVIDIFPGCKARTNRHQDCLELAARSFHSTERFLHLYHYLELDYDYEVVIEIKKIDENNPRALWEAFKLQQSDFDRIYHVLRDFSDISSLEKLIYELRHFPDAALRIFYEYGKDSNPIKSDDAFIEQFLRAPVISRTELNSIKITKQLIDNFASKDVEYAKKLVKLACYWIYRVRCSIAHNKLGEYYLNQADDMELLVRFAEPLLVGMVRYRMSIKT